MPAGPSRVGGEICFSEHADGVCIWPALSVLASGDIVTAQVESRVAGAPSIRVRLLAGRDGGVLRESDVCLGGVRPSDVYRDVAVSALSCGSFVVSWTCHSHQADAEWAVVLMAQEFDAVARPSGCAFVVNTNSTGMPKHTSVTPLSEGGCVVVWSDERCDGGSDVKAALITLDAEGMRSRSHALPSVDLKYGDAGRSADRPVVSATRDGGFLAVWQQGSERGLPEGCLKGRLFDAAAWPRGPEFVVEVAREGDARNRHVMSPALAVLSDSRFVLSWIEGRPGIGSAQPEIDLLARIFTASGLPQGEAFVVRSSFDPLIGMPSVAALAGGGFAIAWEVQNARTALGVRAQVFTAAGYPVGAELASAGNGIDPRVHPLADGGFLLSWAAADGVRTQRVRVAPSLGTDLGFGPAHPRRAFREDGKARSPANHAERR